MQVPLHCRCGTLQGSVESRHVYGRAVCYCKDCQAYARYLGPSGTMDAHGGTGIVAMSPASVRLTAGLDQLACMSLGEKGLLRWYAACCRTAVANTPRDAKVAYVGVIATCLGDTPQALDAAFGPPRFALNTRSAIGEVSSTPVATFLGGLKIFLRLLAARFKGHRSAPFFDAATGQPVRTPTVLTTDERA